MQISRGLNSGDYCGQIEERIDTRDMPVEMNREESTPSCKRTACCLAIAITAIVALSRYSTKTADKTAVADSFIRRRLQDDDTSTVTSISLIGERHSGTNWITDHLTECFSDDLIVRTK